MSYLTNDSFVSDEEMENILGNEALLKSFDSADKDTEKKKYRIVERAIR